MIDASEPLVDGNPLIRLPVRPGTGRLLVLTAVFVCAACGLVYELELVALASNLAGDSVTQASVVLSVMVFAMGVGSLAAKRLRIRAAAAFGAVEAVLALVGGLSAMALYACFAWLGQPRPALAGFSLAIGVLIGAEVPLLMTLIQRIRRQDAGGAVADLFAADYVGALAGGLAFPFVLLPWLGQLTSALLTGAVNVLAGGALVLWLFRRDLSGRARWGLLAANAAVLALLALATALTAPFERAARDAVYGGRVRVAVGSGGRETVITGGAGPGQPFALYRDGRLQVDAADERRLHDALVRPALAAGPRGRVLILRGGDGLAARDVLGFTGVRSVTVVEPDAAVTRLARTDPALVRLNEHAYGDARLHAVRAEAFTWLRAARAGSYDVILADLPGPSTASDAEAKLYSQELYGLAARALSGQGRLAVAAGPPAADFWTVDATVRAAGLRTVPYTARDGPPDTGFVLAGRRIGEREISAVRGAGVRVLERAGGERAPSTLLHPRYG